jgi:hypothetical protein
MTALRAFRPLGFDNDAHIHSSERGSFVYTTGGYPCFLHQCGVSADGRQVTPWFWFDIY